MKKLLIATAAIAAIVAVPAQAKPGKAKNCAKPTKSVGYNASGTFVSGTWTQVAGADTPDDTSDDRYDGTVTVNVTKVNHKGEKGEQTYTLDNDRLTFSDTNGDGTADQPVAGDPVKVHGKITKLKKKCTVSGFEPTVDARKVQFKAPKTEDTQAPAKAKKS